MLWLAGLALASAAPPLAGVPVTVRDPDPGQVVARGKKEHCTVTPDLLARIGGGAGRQVRIARGSGEFAVFTAVEAVDEGQGTSVRVGRAGRLRLGTSAEGFAATVSAQVARSDLAEADAKAQGELVERLDDDGSQTGLLVLAPHGGQVEAGTDRQAERVVARLNGRRVSAWRAEGYHPRGGKSAFDRWHITSTDIHEASYPLLGRVANRRFDYAVSFHGMADDRILVGGAGPARLKIAVRDAIRAALAPTGIAVDIALPGDANAGVSPRNIVNRYSAAGVQIEQSPRVRRDHWQAIADAVAQVYAGRL